MSGSATHTETTGPGRTTQNSSKDDTLTTLEQENKELKATVEALVAKLAEFENLSKSLRKGKAKQTSVAPSSSSGPAEEPSDHDHSSDEDDKDDIKPPRTPQQAQTWSVSVALRTLSCLNPERPASWLHKARQITSTFVTEAQDTEFCHQMGRTKFMAQNEHTSFVDLIETFMELDDAQVYRVHWDAFWPAFEHILGTPSSANLLSDFLATPLPKASDTAKTAEYLRTIRRIHVQKQLSYSDIFASLSNGLLTNADKYEFQPTFKGLPTAASGPVEPGILESALSQMQNIVFKRKQKSNQNSRGQGKDNSRNRGNKGGYSSNQNRSNTGGFSSNQNRSGTPRDTPQVRRGETASANADSPPSDDEQWNAHYQGNE